MAKFLKNQRGFTLVELMVVVAIIAILSSIAIPNFKKFQGKAKTSEAKLQLSSLYSTEIAFLSDADVYATCLKDMGFDPGDASQRFYSVGFGSGAGELDSTNYDAANNKINGVTCHFSNDDTYSFWPAGKTAGGAPIYDHDALENTLITPEGDRFRAAAQGNISASAINDPASAAFIESALDAVVGQAYAQTDTEDEEGINVHDCEESSGSSLFTINDKKNLTSHCGGY